MLLKILWLFLLVSKAHWSGFIISEIAWMWTTTSANNEWIELHNTSDKDISLEWYTLIAEDWTPSISLKGEISSWNYYLLERTDETTIPDIKADLIYTWALENTWEKLYLKNSSWDIIDQVISWTQWNTSTKETMLRQADLSWTNWKINWSPKFWDEPLHETNSISWNHIPVAIINQQTNQEVQGFWELEVNVTWENSYDIDNDEISFNWDFWDWSFSNKQNPPSHKFYEGSHIIKLTVTDSKWASSEAFLTILVEPGLSINQVLKWKYEYWPSSNKVYISEISLNGSGSDWIEFSCPNCTNNLDISNLWLYDNAIFDYFPYWSVVSSKHPFVLNIYSSAKNILHSDSSSTAIKSKWLIKTNDQLFLIDKKWNILDWICWENSKWSKDINKSEKNLLYKFNLWQWECLNSDLLTKKNLVYSKIWTWQWVLNLTWSKWEPNSEDISDYEIYSWTSSKLPRDTFIEDFHSKYDWLKVSELMTGNFNYLSFINDWWFLIDLSYYNIEINWKKIPFPNKQLWPQKKLTLSHKSLKARKWNLKIISSQGKVIQNFDWNNLNEWEAIILNKWKYINEIKTLDSDKDWLFDYQESILQTSSTLVDTDNDHISDLNEYLAWTNPTINSQTGTLVYKKYLSKQIKIFKVKPLWPRASSIQIKWKAPSNSVLKLTLNPNTPSYKVTSDDKWNFSLNLAALNKWNYKINAQVFDWYYYSTPSKAINLTLTKDFIPYSKQKTPQAKAQSKPKTLSKPKKAKSTIPTNTSIINRFTNYFTNKYHY